MFVPNPNTLIKTPTSQGLSIKGPHKVVDQVLVSCHSLSFSGVDIPDEEGVVVRTRCEGFGVGGGKGRVPGFGLLV